MKSFDKYLPLAVGVVVILAAVAVPPFSGPLAAKTVAVKTLPVPNDLFGMSVIDFVVWLVAPTGVLGWVLGEIFKRLEWPSRLEEFIVSVTLAAFAAIVQAGSGFVPPDILGASVGQVIVLLIQFLAGLAIHTRLR